VRISSESSEVQIGPVLGMEKTHITVLVEAEGSQIRGTAGMSAPRFTLSLPHFEIAICTLIKRYRALTKPSGAIRRIKIK